jgi:hypothetical protein
MAYLATAMGVTGVDARILGTDLECLTERHGEERSPLVRGRLRRALHGRRDPRAHR